MMPKQKIKTLCVFFGFIFCFGFIGNTFASDPIHISKNIIYVSDIDTMVYPEFIDGSTNIDIYVDYGQNNIQQYGGSMPVENFLINDWIGNPLIPNKYILIEYNNDGGNFMCMNTLTPSECQNDPHFLGRADILVREDITGIITMPPNFSNDLIGNTSMLFEDISPFLLLILGIPFGIYVIKKIILLFY
jgi:hypothetical protein